jgi:hypothetical protein
MGYAIPMCRVGAFVMIWFRVMEILKIVNLATGKTLVKKMNAVVMDKARNTGTSVFLFYLRLKSILTMPRIGFADAGNDVIRRV